MATAAEPEVTEVPTADEATIRANPLPPTLQQELLDEAANERIKAGEKRREAAEKVRELERRIVEETRGLDDEAAECERLAVIYANAARELAGEDTPMKPRGRARTRADA